MNMMLNYRSAFVPHDLAKPIKGAKQGPLAGLCVVLKDMYDVAGERTGGGNPQWLAAQTPAKKHAVVVQKLLDAGADITGKAICEEFIFSVTGANMHYGTPVNPRAPGRLPGGSSSGSASAVASGACDLALGSDTGGSIRIPASFCGIYGLRPTHGRIDETGVMAMAPSFDVPGWFAASPGVFHKAGAVLLGGKAVSTKIERMIVLDDAFEAAEPAIAALMKAALGHMVVDLPKAAHDRIAPQGFDAWRDAFRAIQGYEVWQSFGAFIEKYKPTIGPGIRERMEFSSKVTRAQMESARLVHEAARKHIRATVPPGTILALPTAPCIAPPVDIAGAEADAFRARVMLLTCTAGLGGLPQVSLPIGTVSGCPAGLSFIGWAGGDEALLDLAYALSRHCGMAA